MTNIIENNAASDKEAVPILRVGKGSSSMSIKQYQNIYHQITGRTEQISRRYKEHFQLELADIEQLHYKISQLCDVQHVLASNEVISIFYERERKEQFTSFARFKRLQRKCY